MSKEKYPDYNWIWLVVALVAPNIQGLINFFISGNIISLEIGIIGSVLLFTFIVYFLKIWQRHPKLESETK